MAQTIQLSKLERALSGYKSATNKRYALVCLRQYVRGDEVQLEQFDNEFVQGYLTSLVKAGKSTATTELYRRELRTLLKDAYPDYADHIKVAFSRPAAKRHARKNGLSTSAVSRLARLHFGDRIDLTQARDVFMYAFYCAGLEYDQLRALTVDDCDEHYVNLPDGRKVVSTINLQSLSAMYRSGSSKKLLPFCEHINNTCHTERLKEIEANYRLPNLAEADAPTKAWISVANDLGIDCATIAGCVNKQVAILSNYSGETNRDQALADAAITKVCNEIADNTTHWYAMNLRRSLTTKITPDDIIQRLQKSEYPYLRNLVTYYPCEDIQTRVGNKRKIRTNPFISRVMFFRTRAQFVPTLSRHLRDIAWIYRQVGSPDAPYAIISQREMCNFQRAVSQFTDDIEVSLVENDSIEVGRRVRLVGGQFDGCEGYIVEQRASGVSTGLRDFIVGFTSLNSFRFKIQINEAQIIPLD